MINQVQCVMGECDNCGEGFENYHSGFSIFLDAGLLQEEMSEAGWYCHGTDENYPDDDFCPKCFKYDETVDDKIIVDLSRKKPNSEQNHERSVATDDDSSNAADNQTK